MCFLRFDHNWVSVLSVGEVTLQKDAISSRAPSSFRCAIIPAQSSHWLLSFIFILACQTGGGKIVRNTENMSKETICKTEPRNRTGRLRRQKLQVELAEWGSFTTITCLGHVKACSGLKIQDQSGWIHIQQMGSRAHHLNMVCYFFLF